MSDLLPFVGPAAKIVDTVVTGIGNRKNREAQEQINKENREAAERINNENIAFQQAANARNEALMREGWARDDSAVQRRAADLKAAGINPLLAGSSGGMGSQPMTAVAPQKRELPKEEAAYEKELQMSEIANAYLQGQLMKAQIDHTEAETNRVVEQTIGDRLQNEKNDFMKQYWQQDYDTSYENQSQMLATSKMQYDHLKNQVARLEHDFGIDIQKGLRSNDRRDIELGVQALENILKEEKAQSLLKDALDAVPEMAGTLTETLGEWAKGTFNNAQEAAAKFWEKMGDENTARIARELKNPIETIQNLFK